MQRRINQSILRRIKKLKWTNWYLLIFEDLTTEEIYRYLRYLAFERPPLKAARRNRKGGGRSEEIKALNK